MIRSSITWTRNAATSAARRNEFSRESANDCGTHDCNNNIILYTTLRAAVIQSDERTPVRPSRTTDRECATSRVAGKPPSSWTTKKKNEQSSPSGRMGAEEDAGQAPPAGRPPSCVPVAGPWASAARARPRRDDVPGGGETERRKRSGGGYHRLLAAAGAVIGQPWKGERCSFRARTRASYRYASFYNCRDTVVCI